MHPRPRTCPYQPSTHKEHPLTTLRKLMAVVAVCLGLLGGNIVAAEPAGAVPAQEYWIAAAWGTIQGVYDTTYQNHHWAEYYNSNGQHIFRAFDTWVPWYCSQIEWIGGNFYTGVPAEVSFWNPGLGGWDPYENGQRGCWIANSQNGTDAYGQVRVYPHGCWSACFADHVSTAGSLYTNPNRVAESYDCYWLGNCRTGDSYRAILRVY